MKEEDYNLTWYYCEDCDRAWYPSGYGENKEIFCRDRIDLGVSCFKNLEHRDCPFQPKDKCLLKKYDITIPDPVYTHPCRTNTTKILAELKRLKG